MTGAFPKLEVLVRSVLKSEAARHGKTTKKDAGALVWKRVERLGGPSKIGIGSGAIIMGCMHYIHTEIGRQFKCGLTEHEVEYILPTTIPEELIKLVGRVPRWIAIEEGTDALWIYWRNANCEHWGMNALLKRKKAEQTLNAARFSLEGSDYMKAHGIKSLGDVFREK